LRSDRDTEHWGLPGGGACVVQHRTICFATILTLRALGVPYRCANGKSAAEKPALYGQGQALQLDLEALAYRKQSTALIARVARARRDAARRQG
jgi:hypothetical protein